MLVHEPVTIQRTVVPIKFVTVAWLVGQGLYLRDVQRCGRLPVMLADAPPSKRVATDQMSCQADAVVIDEVVSFLDAYFRVNGVIEVGVFPLPNLLEFGSNVRFSFLPRTLHWPAQWPVTFVQTSWKAYAVTHVSFTVR